MAFLYTDCRKHACDFKNYHSLNTQLLRLEANEKFKSKNLVALLCHDIANSLNLIDGHTFGP